MAINRKNYETYFIDYLEGNLDENMVDEFIEFLQQNPDLKDELKDVEAFELKTGQAVFDGKEKLYKEKLDSSKEFDNAAISTLEGDISPVDENEFQGYLSQNPDKKRDVALFQKTKLVPDQTITYTNKDRLYNRPKAVKLFIKMSRFAAVILLFFTLSVLLKQYNEILPPKPLMVKAEGEKIKKVLPLKEDGEKKDKKRKVIKPVEQKVKEEKPKKSIRESGRGRLDDEKTSVIPRDSAVYPSLAVNRAELFLIEEPSLKLANMDHLIPSVPEEDLYPDDMFLADRIKQKTGMNDFKLNQITKAGLNFASSITKNKVSYQTNNDGEVTSLALDTRLLGFSIPVNKR